LVDRAVELAPDSAHVWTTKARVEARGGGDPREAVIAWQRAWELSPAGAPGIVSEAWSWAQELGLVDELVERMLSTLRATEDPTLAVGLADRVARRNPEQAASALLRVAPRSSDAQLALVRLRLARGQRDAARDAAVEVPAARSLACDACGAALARFTFRCPRCGAWDRVVVERTLTTVEPTDPAARSVRPASPR
jgi:lipopolysaccharide biosynthesis regulator YciM